MITIGKLYIKDKQDCSFLKASFKVTQDSAFKYIELREKYPNAVFLTDEDYPPKSWNNDDFCLWFSVESKYKKYLCSQRSDAFVVIALWYAMATGSDIKFDTPISATLYKNLTDKLIPALCPINNQIKLIGPVESEPVWCENKTGCGMSCGVDSFYSAQRHLRQFDNISPQIDYFTIYDMEPFRFSDKKDGLHTAYNNSYTYNCRLAQSAQEVADAFSVPLIKVHSNFSIDLYRGGYIYGAMYRWCACSLALQHLFSNYINSSSGHVGSAEVNLFSPSQHYENLLCECLRTDTFKYLMSDDDTRVGKIKSLADNEVFQKYIDVCFNDNNCAECFGCWKTMFCLDFIGKIDKYNHIWDISDYKNNRERHYTDFIKFSQRPEAAAARVTLKQLLDMCDEIDNEQTRLFKKIYESLK